MKENRGTGKNFIGDFYNSKSYHGRNNPKRKNNKGKAKVPVICENTGQEFESMTAAGEFFNIPISIIVNSCKGQRYGSNYKGLAFDYKPIF